MWKCGNNFAPITPSLESHGARGGPIRRKEIVSVSPILARNIGGFPIVMWGEVLIKFPGEVLQEPTAWCCQNVTWSMCPILCFNATSSQTNQKGCVQIRYQDDLLAMSHFVRAILHQIRSPTKFVKSTFFTLTSKDMLNFDRAFDKDLAALFMSVCANTFEAVICDKCDFECSRQRAPIACRG